MVLQVRLANEMVDYFEDRYDPAGKGHENLYHVAELDSEDRLTVHEVYERWVSPSQDGSRARKPDAEKARKLEEERRRTVAVYLPGQWRSYRVSPVDRQAAARKTKRKR